MSLICWVCEPEGGCLTPDECSGEEVQNSGEQGELFDDTMQSIQLRESGEMQS